MQIPLAETVKSRPMRKVTTSRTAGRSVKSSRRQQGCAEMTSSLNPYTTRAGEESDPEYQQS
jgi:hypothetical protein